MNIDIPRKVRLTLYIVTSIGSLLVTYFVARGSIGGNEVTLWTGFTAFVAAMAGININPPKTDVDETPLDPQNPATWR